MSNLEKAQEMAERLRKEPYSFLTNDCLIKSAKLKKECVPLGIPVRIVACIGLARAQVFRLWWMTIPVVHGWAEVEGKRIEVSRPVGVSGVWGIIPANIKPVIKIRF
jgi:hypothetical protein